MKLLDIQEQGQVGGGIPPAVAIVAVAAANSPAVASVAGWVGAAIGAGLGAVAVTKIAQMMEK
jgi:hypothetical protein